MSRPMPRVAQATCAIAMAAAIAVTGRADQGAAPRPIPLESARFLHEGAPVVQGTFAGNLMLDAVSIGDATFSRDRSTLHAIAAVRVSVGGEGRWTPLADEELAAGGAAARIVAARDMVPAPSTAIDTLGGLSVSTMLLADGRDDVRIDVFLPMGVLDDAPGRPDRGPEALLVGPPPSGPVFLRAILAGDIDDPVVAEEPVTVTRDAVDAGRSGAAVIVAGSSRPMNVAMVGYDLDDLGAHEAGAVGFRLEVPRGVTMAFKLFGLGEAPMSVLASAAALEDTPLMASLGGGALGFGGGGGGGSGRMHPFPTFVGPRSYALGGDGGSGGGGGGGVVVGSGSGGGNGGGGGGNHDGGGGDPPVPAPGAVALLALVAAHGPSRRRG